MIGPDASGFDVEEFLREVFACAAGAVNDCRLDYAEVQLDKESLDRLADHLGVKRIDWHPEPCRHEGTRWVE